MIDMARGVIFSSEGQRDAVTILFARMTCRIPDGPCNVCLDFCREWIMPRAFPIIKEALETTERTGRVSYGFGALLHAASLADPMTAPKSEDHHGTS